MKAGLDRLLCCGLALVLALVLTSRAVAVAPEIKDNAKFFSPEVVKKANEEIREIYRKYNKDVLVETITSLPDDQNDKLKAMTAEEKNRFWQKLAEDRAAAKVVHGVYILVCKSPSHLQVWVTQREHVIFERQDQEKLIKLLLTNFKAKEFDEGLTAAIKSIRDKLAAAAAK